MWRQKKCGRVGSRVSGAFEAEPEVGGMGSYRVLRADDEQGSTLLICRAMLKLNDAVRWCWRVERRMGNGRGRDGSVVVGCYCPGRRRILDEHVMDDDMPVANWSR